MKACPYRANFYAKLGPEDKSAEVEQQLSAWLAALEKIVSGIEAEMEKHQYAKGM